jgi:two-component system phosphate regulon sensor histidine kinase PhoR
LINDVLNFQKMESGSMKFNMSEHSIVQIAEDAFGTMQPFAGKRHIHLSLELAQHLPMATFDADRMIQVLTNLISNAIKFTPANGHVRVSVERAGETLVMRVSDTGMGIPTAALTKIFDRFYRVHRPGKEIKGTGLGLAIVKSIVEAHRGRISVESKENVGTTFTVEFPLHPRSDADILSESEDALLEDTVAP